MKLVAAVIIVVFLTRQCFLAAALNYGQNVSMHDLVLMPIVMMKADVFILI